jgi:hypothetical protein
MTDILAIVKEFDDDLQFILKPDTLEIVEPVEKEEIISEFPDRISIEPSSKYFSSSAHYIGIRVKLKQSEVEVKDCIEYCSSGRWLIMGKRDSMGRLIRVKGLYHSQTFYDADFEVYWRHKPSRQIRRALKRIG